MADWDDRTRQGFGSVPRAGGDVASRTTYDAGLRKYMLSIYNYMTSGVLLTGIVALLFATSGAVNALIGPTGRTNGLGFIVAFSPLAIVFAMSFGQGRMKTQTLQLLFWAFAVLMVTEPSAADALVTSSPG